MTEGNDFSQKTFCNDAFKNKHAWYCLSYQLSSSYLNMWYFDVHSSILYVCLFHLYRLSRVIPTYLHVFVFPSYCGII